MSTDRVNSSKHASSSSLEERAKGEARFFDHLVNLVPPKFYHTEEPVNIKFMKAKERQEQKQIFKEQAKQNKREKLNPETARTTIDVQKQKALGMHIDNHVLTTAIGVNDNIYSIQMLREGS